MAMVMSMETIMAMKMMIKVLKKMITSMYRVMNSLLMKILISVTITILRIQIHLTRRFTQTHALKAHWRHRLKVDQHLVIRHLVNQWNQHRGQRDLKAKHQAETNKYQAMLKCNNRTWCKQTKINTVPNSKATTMHMLATSNKLIQNCRGSRARSVQ